MELPLLTSDFQIKESLIAGAASVKLLVPQNPNRWGLVIDVQSGQVAVVSTLSAFLSSQGIVINGSRSPLALNFRDHGALVTSQWNCIAMAGAANLTTIEIIYLPRPQYPMGESDLHRCASMLRESVQ